MHLLRIGIYAWFLDHMALFRLPANSVWVWIAGLLLYDFSYYRLHRMSHEVNLLWTAHVVHHQSEDYNLSTALRQTSSGTLLGWIFYLPMALLGRIQDFLQCGYFLGRNRRFGIGFKSITHEKCPHEAGIFED
jgi:sterol desaturase/sphingolipid hydroxylase (fatty acid hydroxylase superfamily)